MHICLICVQIFAWGKYGGFGRATRLIGRELVKKGIKVTAIVPRAQNQAKTEILDGIVVKGFDIRNPGEMVKIYKDCDAEIFHSQEPSFGTYLAQKFHPEKKHVITFRDTRLFADWVTEFRLPSLSRAQVFINWVYENNYLVTKAVQKADQHFAAAKLLIERAQKRYRLSSPPKFLPTPVEIAETIVKDDKPTVCYFGRWDRRKRLELILDLIPRYPNVNFIVAGNSRDLKYDQSLRKKFSKYPNVEITGFINQFESEKLSKLISKSWIQINTAVREGLPNSFIEGCANKCAILSSVNPDEFSTKFGIYVDSSQFDEGLRFLLEDNRWKELGEEGYNYVKNNFGLNIAINQHIENYKSLLGKKKDPEKVSL